MPAANQPESYALSTELALSPHPPPVLGPRRVWKRDLLLVDQNRQSPSLPPSTPPSSVHPASPSPPVSSLCFSGRLPAIRGLFPSRYLHLSLQPSPQSLPRPVSRCVPVPPPSRCESVWLSFSVVFYSPHRSPRLLSDCGVLSLCRWCVCVPLSIFLGVYLCFLLSLSLFLLPPRLTPSPAVPATQGKVHQKERNQKT